MLLKFKGDCSSFSTPTSTMEADTTQLLEQSYEVVAALSRDMVVFVDETIGREADVRHWLWTSDRKAACRVGNLKRSLNHNDLH